MFTEDSAISISAYDVHYLTAVTYTELVNILHWVTVKLIACKCGKDQFNYVLSQGRQ